MPMFPAIEPDRREYDLGDFAMSTSSSFTGGSVRFNHGYEAIGHDLTFSFLFRTDAELRAIRNHHRSQNGSHVSFFLPPIVWQALSTSSDIVPIAGRWKYAGPPREVHRNGKLHGLEVTLQYVGVASTA